MLHLLLNILYVPVCIFLILVVLLQTGKRADLAGAFGGGGSQTAFGARGAATLLTKLTTGAAVLFMICALSLSILTSRSAGTGGTVLDDVPEEAATEAPAEPALPSSGGDADALPEAPAETEPAGEAQGEVDLTAEDPPADDSQP